MGREHVARRLTPAERAAVIAAIGSIVSTILGRLL